MAYLTSGDVNNKDKWLTRVEAAVYIGATLSEFSLIEQTGSHWIVSARQSVVINPRSQRPVDLIDRYYKPYLDKYIATKVGSV
jgi:hypothetical protein